MSRGALLLYDVFVEKIKDVRLDPDYAAGIEPDDTQRIYRHLFAGVLVRGIRDAIGNNQHYKDSAQEWLNSDSIYIASFKYVCDVLGLDIQKVREKVKTHIRNKNAGLPGTINMPYLRG